MAHLSDFSQQRQAETERLLSELVSATLGAKVWQMPVSLVIYHLRLMELKSLREPAARLILAVKVFAECMQQDVSL